jgi:hypothetical protein
VRWEKRKKTQQKITENKKNKFCFVSSGGVTREREREAATTSTRRRRRRCQWWWLAVSVCFMAAISGLRDNWDPGSPSSFYFFLFYFFADWRRERDLCACEFCIDQRERERKKRKEKKGE